MKRAEGFTHCALLEDNELRSPRAVQRSDKDAR
jgi:hypothetical protein